MYGVCIFIVLFEKKIGSDLLILINSEIPSFKDISTFYCKKRVRLILSTISQGYPCSPARTAAVNKLLEQASSQ